MSVSTVSHIGSSTYLSGITNYFQREIGTSTDNNSQPNEKQNNIDTMTFSQEGLGLSRSSTSSDQNTNKGNTTNVAEKLNGQEIQQLQELKQRDTEVRTHEMAHVTAAGQYARGGASFTYQKGPDGVSYAVGGEVDIDMAKERTPEATMAKMQTIKRAALAPASPSPADRSIAAQASFIESQARQELLTQSQQKLLHADTAKNPAASQEVSTPNQGTKISQPSTTYNTSRSIFVAYQRVSGY